jgi:hypothetical protein
MWIYKNKPLTEVPEGYIGFVYKISCINKSNEYFGWTYWGMKGFFSTITKKLGKKAIANLPDKRMSKKVKTTNESNWVNYNSSNKELQVLIKKNPTHFKKEILVLCKTKKQLSYCETEVLFEYDVLRNEKNWNGNILGKWYKRDLI